MNIALHNADSKTAFPNLALAKLAAYHRKQGNRVSFFMPLYTYDRVYSSKVFTFSKSSGYLPNNIKTIRLACDTKEQMPIVDKAVEAREKWNALPRALTWTTEPPKVAGRYYQRWNWDGHWGDVDVSTIEQRSVDKIRKNADRQWTGPIPLPKEPIS